ncbi:MAG: hypothetical protein O3C69_07310 [Chloroflexi bacterium]|nr:hypothetical protein [Chloroflexota bacterium]
MAAPDFDQHAGFLAAAEPFKRQARIAELALEALIVTVLPRFTRIDVRGEDARVGTPCEDHVAEELRSVVRAQEMGCAALEEEPLQVRVNDLELPQTAEIDGLEFAEKGASQV